MFQSHVLFPMHLLNTRKPSTDTPLSVSDRRSASSHTWVSNSADFNWNHYCFVIRWRFGCSAWSDIRSVCPEIRLVFSMDCCSMGRLKIDYFMDFGIFIVTLLFISAFLWSTATTLSLLYSLFQFSFLHDWERSSNSWHLEHVLRDLRFVCSCMRFLLSDLCFTLSAYYINGSDFISMLLVKAFIIRRSIWLAQIIVRIFMRDLSLVYA